MGCGSCGGKPAIRIVRAQQIKPLEVVRPQKPDKTARRPPNDAEKYRG